MHIMAWEPEIIIAELACHDDIVIDRHVVQVFFWKAFEDAGEAGAGAAAAERQRPGAVDGDAFGMQQAVEQTVVRQVVVEEFVIGEGGGEGCGGVPAFVLRGVVQGRVDAAGAGDFFQDQGAGAPSVRGPVAGEMDLAAELLTGFEVVQRHFGERAALDGDDALVAVLLALVDGEGEVAGAEEGFGGGGGVVGQQGCEFFAVGDGVAAQFAGVGAVGEQHGDRAVALRLQAERAAEFQRGGEAGGESEGLADEAGDDRVVVVAGEQGLGERAEADEAAADRALREEERQNAARHDKVGHRRTAAIEEGWGVGHGVKIGGSGVWCYPALAVVRWVAWYGVLRRGAAG